ncbi:D-glycero-beta-D-manno-heptose 1,7-bisphosphate 7-phosphatase [Eionea flava]
MKVAFLDRDGVINVDHGYVHCVDRFEFLPGVIKALQLLVANGFSLIVVTNQSGIGRGYYSEADYQKLTHWYVSELAKHKVNILDVFHCPHSPEENCDCRKPKSGLFDQACEKYAINMEKSLMVGDKLSDIEAAISAGVAFRYLVGSVKNAEKIDCSSVLTCLNLMQSVNAHIN